MHVLADTSNIHAIKNCEKDFHVCVSVYLTPVYPVDVSFEFVFVSGVVVPAGLDPTVVVSDFKLEIW